MNTAEKENLLKEWIKFKKAEDAQKKKRIAVEEQLILAYGTSFDGNSKTFKEDEIGFSINLKKNIAYSLDQEKWKSIRTEIPANIRPEKITFSLDLEGFKFLKEHEEHLETYKKVSDCVTIKENKTSVKVEKL
jgi:hypothetical protein